MACDHDTIRGLVASHPHISRMRVSEDQFRLCPATGRTLLFPDVDRKASQIVRQWRPVAILGA
jgi:hypothetical protein